MQFSFSIIQKVIYSRNRYILHQTKIRLRVPKGKFLQKMIWSLIKIDQIITYDNRYILRNT